MSRLDYCNSVLVALPTSAPYVITHHRVQYHQYADDTQLHLTIHADNTPARLSVLAECTTDIVKKLNSLKHLVRTTVAESHN